ncbi:MAG: diacylglycerol/lipid kinase family protein, partial [Bryobacteraceae bacterium]
MYNPFAGQLMGRKEHVLQRALTILQGDGNQVQAVPTTGPTMAADLARDCIAEGADLVLVAGGDGTINEVVNGMAHSQVPLGILPAGTANVLATELGLGRKMHRAAAILGDCVPGRVSLGRIQSDSVPGARHFLL